MTPPFDWSLIRSFLAVLDHGSLLAAARALHASQPTLGRHITELESQVGKLLFERTGRGLQPTPAALLLAEPARAMETAALQMERQWAGAETRVTGSVRISASTPVAYHLLPPILAAMRQSLPDVHIELVVSNAVSNLLRREADIALRMVAPDQSTLVAKRIGKVSIGSYASRDYLKRRGTPREPQDLLQHELIGLDSSDEILRGFAAFGAPATREHFALRTDDLTAGWQAVRAGLGVGFVADYVARSDPQVVPLLTSLKLPTLPMWLVVHREIRTNKRIRTVYDFLADQIPKAL